MKNIALLGYGRMGRTVQKAALARGMNVLFAVDNHTDTQDGVTPIIKTAAFEEMVLRQKPDVIIDFSRPKATMEIAPLAIRYGIDMVVCTTGFSLEQQEVLKSLAGDAASAFLLAPNITPGINILMLFAKIASRMLPDHDIQITDYHFKEKHDCPSGTALKLAHELEKTGKKPDVYGVRAGNIVGKHTVLLAGAEDQIEISHQSYFKDIYAKSALDAATKIARKKGFMTMKDILNMEKILKACCDEA